jgi:hypothetical protein
MLACYLDEQTSERLGEALERLGHDVTSANKLKRKGLSDALHLLLAADANRVLISYDIKDFKLLHEAWHFWTQSWGVANHHAGILLIHTFNKPAIGEVAAAIDQIANEQDILENRVFIWKRGIGWKEIS